jgi:small subunit ribosomal protein S1
VFVELEENLEGLLHISELADHKVENPEDIVQVGQELEVRILRVDTDDRKIGLSRKLDAEIEVADEEDSEAGKAPGAPKELKGGTGGDSGPLFSFGAGPEAAEETPAEEVPAEEASAEEAPVGEDEEKPAE